ncbi:MAG: DUF4279 domain-containing protein [Pseudomonadota bacterium]
MDWYCAHIIVATRLFETEQGIGPVEERLVLIEAENVPAARLAAVAIGRAAETVGPKEFVWKGVRARLEFMGVRDIRKISFGAAEAPPRHGTELTRSIFEVSDYDTARHLAFGEPVAVTYASSPAYDVDLNEDPLERAGRYSKRTESEAPLVSVALLIYGANLDPDQISQILRTKPTHAQRKNDRHVTSTGRIVIRKTGLWKFGVKIDSPEVDDHLRVLAEHLEPLVRALKEQGLTLDKLPNVEEAFVDIFRVETSMWEQVLTLSPDNARLLADLRVPIKVTVAY